MKISLEYQNYSIFVLALKDLVNGIYGLFFYAGTNQSWFLLVAKPTQKILRVDTKNTCILLR